jgi:uncharacterized damage-inducible protein DinB
MSGRRRAIVLRECNVDLLDRLLEHDRWTTARLLELSAVARAVRDRGGWDERWTYVLETPPVQQTYGGAIGHVIMHSMHHRAQALYMLRALGVPDMPEGDVLSWEAQHRA